MSFFSRLTGKKSSSSAPRRSVIQVDTGSIHPSAGLEAAGGKRVSLAKEKIAPNGASTYVFDRETEQVNIKKGKSDQDFIDELPGDFFLPEFDGPGMVLRALLANEDMPEHALENELFLYDTVKSAIDRRLSDRVLKNYGRFIQSSQSIHDVKLDLTMTGIHCKNGRTRLKELETITVQRILKTLAAQRRKARTVQLLHMAGALSKALKQEAEVAALIRASHPSNLVQGIRRNRECLAQLEGFTELHCAKDISERCVRHESELKGVIQNGLRATVAVFDADSCVGVLDALRTLGLAHVKQFSDGLKQYASEGIERASQHALAHAVASKRVNSSSSYDSSSLSFSSSYEGQTSGDGASNPFAADGGTAEDKEVKTVFDALLRVPFKQVCGEVPMDGFRDCYVHICQRLVKVMYSCYKLTQLLFVLGEKCTPQDMGRVRAVSWHRPLPTFASADEAATASVHSTAAADHFTALQPGQYFVEHERVERKGRTIVRHDAGWSVCDMDGQAFISVASALSSSAPSMGVPAADDPVYKQTALFTDVSPATAYCMKRAWQNLDAARGGIWEQAQERATRLLDSVHPTTSSMPFEEFLSVLSTGYKFIDIGAIFSGSESNPHLDSIVAKSKEYFANFHKDNFSYLKTALHRDMWRALPLGDQFRIRDIKEVREFVRGASDSSSSSSSFSSSAAANGDALGLSYGDNEKERSAELFLAGRNPFALDDEEEKEGVASEEKQSVAAAIAKRRSSVVAATDASRDAVVATSSSLTVVRLFGKYMNVMKSLSSLAVDALDGMHEVFDFYLYCVFSLFGISPYRFFTEEFHLYRYLKKAVRSVRSRVESGQFGGGSAKDLNLEHKETKESVSNKRTAFSFNKRSKAPAPKSKSSQPTIPQLVKLNGSVDLSSQDTLQGAMERIVATESMQLLVDVVSLSQSHMKQLLPKEDRHRVTDFVTYASCVTQEFSKYMYRNLPPFLLPMTKTITPKIDGVRWDKINQIQSKHNAYVDLVMLELTRSRAVIVGNNGERSGEVSAAALQRLWADCVQYLAEELVGSYSKLKKCTTEGRALMSVDINVLRTGIEAITDCKTSDAWEYVSEYISAYYYPEADFLKWVHDHPSYTLSQYISLATCGAGAGMKKAERRRFLVDVENAVNSAMDNADKKRSEEAASI